MKSQRSDRAPLLIRKVTPVEVYAGVERHDLVVAPDPAWDGPTVAACERLYDRSVRRAAGECIPDHAFVDLPRWVFLEYLVHCRGLLARGANAPDLDPLGPGLPSRNILGWDHPCCYAYASGLQAIFFAILDRQRLQALAAAPYASTLHLPAGAERERFHFAVDYRALPHAPWRRGTVYLLPRAPFTPQYREAIWFSPEPVRPLARISVAPAEWPLLDQVRGMDAHALWRCSEGGLTGWPWANDDRLYPHRHYRPLAQQARTYIDRHHTENVSLADLGARAGVSSFKLLRLFRAHIGLSPLEYQTGCRLHRARSLLRSGMSIAEVAAETGFVDQSHLNRLFKLHLGLTPGQYLRLQEYPRRA